MTTTTLGLQAISGAPAPTSAEAGLRRCSELRDDEELTLDSVLACYDPNFRGTVTDLRRGSYLASLIYSLEDPWRARFIDLIAHRSDGERRGQGVALDDSPDSRRQVAVWLADRSLGRMIRLMLRTWMHVV